MIADMMEAEARRLGYSDFKVQIRFTAKGAGKPPLVAFVTQREMHLNSDPERLASLARTRIENAYRMAGASHG